MKRYIYMAVAAIAVLSSCSSDIESTQNGIGKHVYVFTAKMEGCATRATFETSESCAAWEVGDVISVDGHEYKATTAGTEAEFSGLGAKEETHHAYFPASIYNGGNPALPAVQTYTDGKFDMPIYAESTSSTLEFKNLCAVLAIRVTSDDIAMLKSIKVKSDKKMNGSFAVSGNKAVVGDDGTNEVVLTIAKALMLSEEGTTFYIAIPAQEYQYLNIFLSADGETYTVAMGTKNVDGLGDFKRSKMFVIDYETNALKMWDGNVFIADRNIDASSPEDVGGYYTWGGTYRNGPGIKWNDDHNAGFEALSGDTDTATKLWGSNWRMMTEDEFEMSAGKGSLCIGGWRNIDGVKGYWIRSGGNNYSNYIFLPAGGAYYDCYFATDPSEFGVYYLSKPRDDKSGIDGYAVFIGKRTYDVITFPFAISASVRPVLDE